ncbi:trypsin-like peptidase domain-containing protein [Phycisphaeraceae bacterium D3-23]
MRTPFVYRRLMAAVLLGCGSSFVACASAQAVEESVVDTAVEAGVDIAELREPKTLEQLQALEAQVEAVVAMAAPATVCIRAGGGSGSGVIVSEDGLVLTAGHVAMRPGTRVTFIFPDGSTARGEALGINEGIDSGLLKITDEGPWPFVEMGDLDTVERGDWVVAMGHPGGFDAERPVVARLGRVLNSRDTVVQSDCTIIGGDSGGPLFDLNGRVVGIHSRIGGGLTANFHVPISTYTDTWDRLAAGEMWNRAMPTRALRAGDAYIGVRPNRRGGAVVGEVIDGQAADNAGMRRGDRVVAVAGKPVESFGDIVHEIRAAEPGDVVVFSVVRGDDELDLELEMGEYNPEE